MGFIVHPKQAKKELQIARRSGFPDIINSTPKNIFIRWANHCYDDFDWILAITSLTLIIPFMLTFLFLVSFSVGTLFVPMIPVLNIVFTLGLIGPYDGDFPIGLFTVSYLVYYHIMIYSIYRYFNENSGYFRNKFFMFGIYRYKRSFPFTSLDSNTVDVSNLPSIIDWLHSNDNLKEMVAINLASHLPKINEPTLESLNNVVGKSESESSRKYAIEIIDKLNKRNPTL